MQARLSCRQQHTLQLAGSSGSADAATSHTDSLQSARQSACLYLHAAPWSVGTLSRASCWQRNHSSGSKVRPPDTSSCPSCFAPPRVVCAGPSATGLLLSFNPQGKVRSISLLSVCKIVQGQTTPVFRREPLPDYEAVSFSLLYFEGRGSGKERSLDLVCRNIQEFETWWVDMQSASERQRSHCLWVSGAGSLLRAVGRT